MSYLILPLLFLHTPGPFVTSNLDFLFFFLDKVITIFDHRLYVTAVLVLGFRHGSEALATGERERERTIDRERRRERDAVDVSTDL